MMDTTHIHRKWLDLPYATQSPAQKLDIYLPESGDHPFPVIMAIHGGAFLFGDKCDFQHEAMLKGLVHGFAVVCINYRLSGEAIFPAQIFDCKAAVRFIRANAWNYHLDPEHIAAWGGSAGGHLSALLGTSAGITELEDLSMGNPQASSAVQAVVDWCGPAENFLKMDDELRANRLGEPDHSHDDSPESMLLGAKITRVPELVKKASPMTYINPSAPPFLIQHGDLDPVVPIQQSANFAAALEKVAGPGKVSFEILHGAGHHGDPGFETDSNLQHIFNWLETNLNKK